MSNQIHLTCVTTFISHDPLGLQKFVFDKTHDLTKEDLVFMLDMISNNFMRYPQLVRSTLDFPCLNTKIHLKSLKKFQDFLRGWLDNMESDMIYYSRIVKEMAQLLTPAELERVQDFLLYNYYSVGEMNEINNLCHLDRWCTCIEDIFNLLDDQKKGLN